MRFDSSSIINLPRTDAGTSAQPKAWSFTTCVGLTFPRACQVAMTRITNQGSLVWNAHIPNWGATSSSENMAIWVITEAGKQIKQSVNIFDCSWLHPNLFLDRFSEVHTCPTLSARDKWLQILLHADLGPKNRVPLCKSTSSSFPPHRPEMEVYHGMQHISHIAVIFAPTFRPPAVKAATAVPAIARDAVWLCAAWNLSRFPRSQHSSNQWITESTL